MLRCSGIVSDVLAYPVVTKALVSGHQVSMVVATVPGQEPVQAVAGQVHVAAAHDVS
jgi:hypothetical protein